jgi:hypothetical protein
MKRNSNSSSLRIDGMLKKEDWTVKRRFLRDENLIGKITFAILVGIGLLAGGCQQMGNIGLVKRGILTDVSLSITVGEALDNYKYFKKTTWREFKTDNGKIVVEFVGNYHRWEGTVRIQFVLNSELRAGPDGNHFEVGHIETTWLGSDGTRRKADAYSARGIDGWRDIYNQNKLGEREGDSRWLFWW